jgi:carbamoyl-phosphate synthase large subunit
MSVLITSPKGKDKLVEAFSQVTNVSLEMNDSVKLIIPTVDEELPFFASAREWFASKGITVMVASENTVYHCRDKAEFSLFCKRHGFLTPRTWQMNCYVKPRFGKGSKNISKFDTSYIVQEECPFPEVSVDYFADMEGTPYSAIARYRLNITNGESQDYEIVKDFKYENVYRFASELGLVGHNVIQGYWTGETFIFGEVNPRFGGGSHFTWDIWNSPRWLVARYDSPILREV